MLKVENVTIKYEDAVILRDISFELKRGKVIALLGANGAGKTTLLRALNGLLKASGGTISLNEKPLAGYSRSEIARKIAVVAQENETRFPINVLEFVLSGRFAHGAAFGWESETDLECAKKALEMCDLAGYEKRLMNRLSGGERQRAVLARSLATEAEILLLDEPTANLDLSHQALMFELVRSRCSQSNYGAIVITHDLNLASEFADEIIVLSGGGISAKGTAGEVLTDRVIDEAFGVKVLLDKHPASGKVRVTTVY
jgi:iron complex transport system ATP-binding protein